MYSMGQVGNLENYFKPFRENILGISQQFDSPYGKKTIVYTDWTASGRLYAPIEKLLLEEFGPFVANTHTTTTVSGTTMTHAYAKARSIIKDHVNAGSDDVLITTGTGMTGAISKFQRILGLKIPEQLRSTIQLDEKDTPVIFVSHMEHHSNQTTWLETLATVEVIPCTEDGLLCLDSLQELLTQYSSRPIKMASITSCSNVTGIKTPYHEAAKLMHAHGGYCFVDFACSAPYIPIDMHPSDPEAYLDAIFMSPHKFLGGPGSTGVVIFNKNLYKNGVPDCPGGGTVDWTNPWGIHKFIDDIEVREDGGTPGFLQVIRASLAIRLKEKMGVDKIAAREKELTEYFFQRVSQNPKISLLAPKHEDRLPVFSFNVEGLHYELAVRILNDRFGIQARGGCSCAGTYGHYLLEIDQKSSAQWLEKISCGSVSARPGWIRVSLHPTTSNQELKYVCDSLDALTANAVLWKEDYQLVDQKYVYNKGLLDTITPLQDSWFEV